MAASADAVRNFVYDVHLYNLKQGWAVVQQLEEKKLDSWERISAAFPVKDPSGETSWDESDEKLVSDFAKACPLLGEKLAAHLAAQAALFVTSPNPQILQRATAERLGSLGDRMNRLYTKEKLPSLFKQTFGNGVRLQGGDKGRLVPFAEAVDHPGFLT